MVPPSGEAPPKGSRADPWDDENEETIPRPSVDPASLAANPRGPWPAGPMSPSGPNPTARGADFSDPPVPMAPAATRGAEGREGQGPPPKGAFPSPGPGPRPAPPTAQAAGLVPIGPPPGIIPHRTHAPANSGVPRLGPGRPPGWSPPAGGIYPAPGPGPQGQGPRPMGGPLQGPQGQGPRPMGPLQGPQGQGPGRMGPLQGPQGQGPRPMGPLPIGSVRLPPVNRHAGQAPLPWAAIPLRRDPNRGLEPCPRAVSPLLQQAPPPRSSGSAHARRRDAGPNGPPAPDGPRPIGVEA